MKEISKTEAKKEIEEFFNRINEKTKEEIRKIKKLASHNKIRLKEKRKLFCKYCFSPKLSVLSIKNKIKRIKCNGCGKESGWVIK